MRYQKILITGGAGFVGSNLAFKFKEYFPKTEVYIFDNLYRRGSELNLPRFKENGIKFFHGDVRNKTDLNVIGNVDLLIECSAEPSVLAGLYGQTDYLIDTNLGGLINCLNYARLTRADFIFFSTSRVYPYEILNTCNYIETDDRFDFSDNQKIAGISSKGLTEEFPIIGAKSLYGTTKLASELFIKEYIESFHIKAVINRFGCIAGPWQMGKVDQGVLALWIARHVFKKEIKYIGFEGSGKQVRDFIHIDDVFDVVNKEINMIDSLSGRTFNIGGGLTNSLSLKQLTQLCQKITGNKIHITKESITRPGDLKTYITNNSMAEQAIHWKQKKDIYDIVSDTYKWIENNKIVLHNILDEI